MSEPILKRMFNLMYPIGSIYFSVNNTDPSELFGGTWESWGNGRVPVGINNSDERFKKSENTGGESEHTLTTEEIPSHNHNITSNFYRFSELTYGLHGDVFKGSLYQNGSYNTNNTGGGKAHNNMPPYIVCYMWKRIG